jgi:hypothetical protein
MSQDFLLLVYHESVSLKPLIIPLGPFRIISKILGDFRSSGLPPVSFTPVANLCGCLYLFRSHNRSVKSCMRTRSQACMVFSCPSVSIIQFTSIKMKNAFRFIYVIGCQINGVSGGKLVNTSQAIL